MTSHHLLVQPRTWVTFDVETMLDEAAAAAAGYKGNGMPSALQRIETACILVATEEPDGTWRSFSLRTFGPLTPSSTC
ncbi:hypothetical protein KZX46_10460 [Polymorphobacter sp. PAMC 29334]|uniref:hypothetical protein n=1 Tax=Polymorphobacter sp. PAMC 29334 TaxID=2862331 RepID=UPI001C77B427|nr:hypothetical protein [Polymorphobacter sp. PAMC 29334]QYE36305.1 hypothetical protein KZX46_10460 [Polymorphobacter sp. PAMC 29334]